MDTNYRKLVRQGGEPHRVMVASPVGGHPGKDANGNNSDGSRRRARAWIGFSAQF